MSNTSVGRPSDEADIIVTGVERKRLPVGSIGLDVDGKPYYKGSGSWVGLGDGPALDDYYECRLQVIWPPEAVANLRLQRRIAEIIRGYREHFEGGAADHQAAAALLQEFAILEPVRDRP